jgi:predicted RNA binding protein YcfA (HicA-like mRNA interferase family)
MSRKKYPPLRPSDVVSILKALGFVFKRQDGTAHAHWELLRCPRGQRRLVSVDMAYAEFDDFLMKNMIDQSGFSRDQFYGATKRSARKGNVPIYAPPAL